MLKEGSATTIPSANYQTSSFNKGALFTVNSINGLGTGAINTKRSQASSLSVQRQNTVSASGGQNKIGGLFKRKDSIDQLGSNGHLKVKNGHTPLLLKQLNQTVQTLKKKQESLPLQIPYSTGTTITQKDRRKKSRDQLMPQVKNDLKQQKVLQNSFTLKHLKLMMNGMSQQVLLKQQETQRATERTISTGRHEGMITGGRTLVTESDFKSCKERQGSQAKNSKILAKNQKHLMSNTKIDGQQLNRSSVKGAPATSTSGIVESSSKIKLITKKKTLANQEGNLGKNNASDHFLSRFYDTGRQTLTSQAATSQKPVIAQ